jgi:hypothetical protein
MMFGSPWHEEYLRIAPRPEDFTVLFEKKTQMDRELKDFSAEDISAIKSPTLLIIGDSDLVRPGTQSRCSAYSVVVSSATPPPAFQPRS